MKKNLYLSLCLLCAFVLWTILVCLVDVQKVGPLNSVGFATINMYFHKLIGTNLTLYYVTDWLSLIPILIIFGFAMLGLCQWIKRKNIRFVDRNILFLGGLYAVVFILYLLFEYVVINYRPVLIDGLMEASYPSSTTLLVLCTMSSAAIQLDLRIKRIKIKRVIHVLIILYTFIMLAGRIASGVHWVSDVIGSVLLSAGLILLYKFFAVEEVKRSA